MEIKTSNELYNEIDDMQPSTWNCYCHKKWVAVDDVLKIVIHTNPTRLSGVLKELLTQSKSKEKEE